MSQYWLYADVETTGITSDAGVVEVAWLITDDNLVVQDKGHSIIDPEMPIPPESSAVHGLTNRDVIGAPTLDEYFSIVLGGKLSAEDFIFCAYNSPFDYRFLHSYLLDGTPQMDLLRLARKIYPNAQNHELATMVYFLDLNVDKGRFHSADGDVTVLLDMTERMSNDTGRSLYELFEYANTPIEHTTMPFGKHKGVPLTQVPASYVSWFLTKAENPDADLVHAFKQLGY
jgi:exodeoxyribonuclease X